MQVAEDFQLDSNGSFNETLQIAIQEYKAQQEKYKLFLSSTSNSDYRGPSLKDKTIGSILNLDCVVLPVCYNPASKDGGNKNVVSPVKSTWSLGLSAHFSTNTVKAGLIEEFGSAWRFVQRKDSFPGVRVIIETAEIGETRKYLGTDLHLVGKDQAAIWNISVLPHHKDDLSPVSDEPDTERGLFVQIDLVGSSNTGLDHGKVTGEYGSSSKTYLSFSHTQPINKNEIELGSLTKQSEESVIVTHQYGENDQNMKYYKSYVWEVMPDS